MLLLVMEAVERHSQQYKGKWVSTFLINVMGFGAMASSGSRGKQGREGLEFSHECNNHKRIIQK